MTVNWMKPRNTEESIDKRIQKAIISSIISVCIQIVVVLVVYYLLHRFALHWIFVAVCWVSIIASAIQIVAMPYLTWVRIKEIRGGELDEARKY